MTRAEKKALEHTGYCRNQSYEDYLRGYKQAEKDLALTWKDLKKLWEIRWTMPVTWEGTEKEWYKELLKRFNEQKNGQD